mmetsp:Transcript_5305/g.10959  ORF Transcript_5305/g.10959 Transcript_5305/m.10959 type:complete len:233 (+) Transcript_5305:362-1060(+)
MVTWEWSLRSKTLLRILPWEATTSKLLRLCTLTPVTSASWTKRIIMVWLPTRRLASNTTEETLSATRLSSKKVPTPRSRNSNAAWTTRKAEKSLRPGLAGFPPRLPFHARFACTTTSSLFQNPQISGRKKSTPSPKSFTRRLSWIPPSDRWWTRRMSAPSNPTRHCSSSEWDTLWLTSIPPTNRTEMDDWSSTALLPSRRKYSRRRSANAKKMPTRHERQSSRRIWRPRRHA